MVHCMAGRGRSGTFAAACLIYKGVKADAAIPKVRLYRPGAIESNSQIQFLKDLTF